MALLVVYGNFPPLCVTILDNENISLLHLVERMCSYMQIPGNVGSGMKLFGIYLSYPEHWFQVYLQTDDGVKTDLASFHISPKQESL